MTTLREAAQQALDILDSEFTSVDGEFCRWCDGRLSAKHNCKLEQVITALRAALAEPVQEQRERELNEALTERDDAEDYIDALLDEVLGPDRAEWSSAYGRADALEEVRERIAQMLKPSIDKAWNRFEAALEQQAEPVQEPVAPIGYLSRVRAQVEQQRTCFPGEDPDYLWTYTHGTERLELFESSSDLEVVRVYTSPPRRKPLTDDDLLSLWAGNTPRPVMGKNKVLAFGRAIERAHGIGGSNE